MEPTLTNFIESNSILNDPDALRERMAEEGYLFFRNLLDPGLTKQTRDDFVGMLSERGLLKSGEPPEKAVATTGAPDGAENWNHGGLLNRYYAFESFHSLPHAPALTAIMAAITEDQVLVHPRNIARIIFPNREIQTTEPHQDFWYIRGSRQTYTAWLPLADCSRDMGGLAVHPGSHKKGRLNHRMHEDRRRLLTLDEEGYEDGWASTEYRLGDALIFHSLTLHKGLPNRSTKNLIRVSMDCRYQAVSEPVMDIELLPIEQNRPWDEIYQGWKSTRCQRYWEKLNLNIIESPKEESQGES